MSQFEFVALKGTKRRYLYSMGNPKRPKDTNERAKFIVDLVTGDRQEPRETNGHKHEGQRKGGLIGGKSRAEKLTKKERVEITKKAANKRWDK